MGCSMSRLEDEDAIRLCRDRKRFVKQAIDERTRFASGHLAYVQSLKRVSAALRDYVEGDEPRIFLSDSYVTPPFVSNRKRNSSFISISPKSIPRAPIRLHSDSSSKESLLGRHEWNQKASDEKKPPSPEFSEDEICSPSCSTRTFRVNYFMSEGSKPILVEEVPQSPEMHHVEVYSPLHHYGTDEFFSMQSSHLNSSFFPQSSNHLSSFPPSPPHPSQWDGFWNSFSVDSYSYPTYNFIDPMGLDEETGLKQVREEEGIPELEDETDEAEVCTTNDVTEHPLVDHPKCSGQELGENAEEEEMEDDSDGGCECEHDLVEQVQENDKMELKKAQNSAPVDVQNKENAVENRESMADTPGFTVYVNKRPTNMSEVVADLEDQFTAVCLSAKELSELLESSRARYLVTANELSAIKMLNPVALFRTASSRSSSSSSSRLLFTSSSSREDDYESSSDFNEESCAIPFSHQSTLDRLYAWEKKLYDEVKSGERIHVAYEKKRLLLRKQDAKGEDPSAVEKTRLGVRHLQTQMKIAIHSIEAVSGRIEALRDEELQPQLLELIQGLARMWRVMAECHQSQKRTLDQAKLLLAGMVSRVDGDHRHLHQNQSSMAAADPERLPRSAANLEAALKNWRLCFETWITSQRLYTDALAGWLLRCTGSRVDITKFPASPRRTDDGAFPMVGLCVHWARLLDVFQMARVVDGIDFFAAGMGSLYARQMKENTAKISGRFADRLHEEDDDGLDHDDDDDDDDETMRMVEVGETDVFAPAKMAEMAVKVLCAGMSVAVSSLAEFAAASADGYADLVQRWQVLLSAPS